MPRKFIFNNTLASPDSDRRRFIQRALQLSVAASLLPTSANLMAGAIQTTKKPVPSSGELIPVIGAGTARTYDVGTNRDALINLHKILKAFFVNGGKLIDSSLLDGSSTDVLGFLLSKIKHGNRLITSSRSPRENLNGNESVSLSKERLKVARLDLMQIADLKNWDRHYSQLQLLKESGKLRYIGLYLSDLQQEALAAGLINQYQIDFIQLPYNAMEVRADKYLLPLAQQRNTAVIAGRPFAGGTILTRLNEKQLPGWAIDIGCHRWSQLLLKFVVGHPAITCTVPGTSQVHHMLENMGANFGPLPDPAQRKKIQDVIQSL